MITHLAHFEFSQKKHWGIIEDEIIHLLPEQYPTTKALLQNKASILNTAKNDINHLQKIKLSDIKLLSPVIGNQRVICQGANYRQHMIESGMNPDAKSFNMFFNKSSASICSSQSDIIKPKHVSLLDYEIELGLIIGKNITRKTEVKEKDLSDYIAAIVITNDVSARDVQIPETQFFKGKSYRTFCPVGPYLCLLDQDSIHYLKQLELELKVNGETRQFDNTENLVFKPAETLTELSGFSDLDVGDLVLTGTPSGCALRIPSPIIVKLFSLLPEPFRWKMFKRIQAKRSQYLQADDYIEASIQSRDQAIFLGHQQNKVTNESS